MGTPELAAVILTGLIEKKYTIVGVVTKPDKPAGRDQEAVASAVKQKAIEYDLPIEQPVRLDQAAVEKIKSWKPDIIIVAAYGKILPPELLSLPGFGCINVHTSLLPKWRGASPIQNALLAGAQETGVTLMLMDEGMDTGDILAQKKIEIMPEDTRESLSARMTDVGRDALLETLPLWIKRTITPVPQDDTQATLCQLIEREDGHILWTESAEDIYNRYRALCPWPGVFAFWKKDSELLRLKLHRISYQKQSPQISHPIGQVFEVGERIGVQASAGIIFLEEVQLEGKTRLPIAEFLLGNKEIINSFLQ
ncbi:MAG: methionyl-tRNA formyltransferase [Candidatus Moranbacteria bacterium RIFCSPHIGHO2_01_FULL_54_31]|nr:MAG: methionyl-tRNA formyltransferase [Candidatus Moranbacteria bacterium RIFCSPHIGHO2_01_FULL_54_31]